MTQPGAATTIDVRTIEPRRRHALIFETFSELSAGQVLELVNDHDPQPLHRQFDNELPGYFEWEYLERGPELFRVSIRRTEPARPCCGACGG